MSRQEELTLTENVDYTVDYSLGRVTILNESVISSGTPVSVSLENQSTFNMQRKKTMIGLDLNYSSIRTSWSLPVAALIRITLAIIHFGR